MTDEEMTAALVALDRDGFAIIRDSVPRARLAELAEVLNEKYDAAQSEGQLFVGGGSVSGHIDCQPGELARFAHEAVTDRGIIDLVEASGAVDSDRQRVTMNYNLPGSHPQHFHSDGLYTEEFLICNVAVVDIGLHNGAIDMIPGTHQRFYEFWRYALKRKYRESTRVPLQQGDVLLRRSTAWHRGMPNLSDAPRPMLSITFGEASAPEGDPFEGDVKFLPNWYGTDRVSRLRERTFVKMPWVYSTLRFGRSLVGKKGYSSW